MQSREFDQMMERNSAKWLEGNIAQRINMQSLVPVKKQMQEIVEKEEVPIPDEKQKEIQTFIGMLKGLNVKPAEIRRRVKIRFDITVV